MVLTAERFVVRRWRGEDAESLVRYANNREVWRNLHDEFPHPYTMADATAWLARCEEDEALEGTYAIEVDGEAVGGIGLRQKTDVHRRMAELGYWLGEPFWGKGIATEAAGLVTRHAFETLDIERIQAFVFAWNPASARVLEKCGYALEGRLRNAIFKDGEITDALVYGILRG